MLGFLSSKKDNHDVVKKEEILFVSVPESATDEEIKMLVSPKAKLFADKLDLKEVYLHFGKEIIIKYDYSI